MKTLFGIFFFMLFSFASVAQAVEKVSLKVYGNCIMCKKRIEAALDTKGIRTATWSAKTKMLDVTFVPSKITLRQIHERVAAVGHDTDLVKAKDTTYADLPFCCLYRDHDHSGFKDNK